MADKKKLVPGSPDLLGRWIYTIQGLMQCTAPQTFKYDKKGTLEVGWAFDNDPKHQAFPNFSALPLAAVTLPTFDPQPVAMNNSTGIVGPPVQDNLPGQGMNAVNPPILGYLPYTESGYVDFLRDGKVDGVLWWTIAGWSNFSAPLFVSGQYRFNQFAAPGFGSAPIPVKQAPPIGGMTLAWELPGPIRNPPTGPLQTKTDFLWDYAFIMVSNDEGQLSTTGRLPRPVTASGTMKRADWDSIARLP